MKFAAALLIACALGLSPACAVVVCTQPLQKALNELAAKGEKLPVEEIRKAQAALCHEERGLLATTAVEDIGNGCMMYSAYDRNGQVVYWAQCAGRQEGAAPCFTMNGRTYCE